MTFNPNNAKPGDGQPAPADAIITVAPDGSGWVYAPAPSAFSLDERLNTLAKEARTAGFAVVILYPEELFGVDVEALQIHLVREGKAYINAHSPEPEE